MCRSLVQVPKDILADPAAELVISLQGHGLKLESVRRLADLAKEKPSARALMGRANEAEQKRDLAAAKAHWLAAAEAATDADAGVLNNAAWFLCTTDEALRDGPRAEALARRAVALSDRGYIRDTLAEALLLNGKLDEARRENEAVLRQDPGNDTARERARRIEAAAKP